MESQSRPPHRVRSLAEARELVAAWKSSGLNKEARCRSQGALRSVLLSWLSRVEAQDVVDEPSRFIELRPAAAAPVAAEAKSASPDPIILELGSGMRVLGLDTARVMDLVRALRQERA